MLDSTYPIYVFKFINIHAATDAADFLVNFSTDTGSNYNVTKTTTYVHVYHDEADSTTALAYAGSHDLAQDTGFQKLQTNSGTDNDQSCSGEMFLFNPSSTTFVKHFISVMQTYHNADYSLQNPVAGYANTTSAIDAVQFKMDDGNIDAGTIKLYGIKDS